MTPTPGQIVHYTLSEQDAAAINGRRMDAEATRRAGLAEADPDVKVAKLSSGVIAHQGNAASVGQVYPAMIVRVWNADPGACNLQVFLDGNDVLWATSVTPGDGPRSYDWPARA